MKVLVYDDKDERIILQRIKELSIVLIQTYKDKMICHLDPVCSACYSCSNMSLCDDAVSVLSWTERLMSEIDHGS